MIISSLNCSLPLVKSSNSTIVGGYIRNDTVWTKENSPYILEDDLIIQPDVSLKIEEGVIVECSLWSIIVEGELRLLGSPGNEIELYFSIMPLTGYKDARIVFTENSIKWKESSLGGSQLEYVKIYCKENTIQYGLIEGGTIKIDHISIYGSETYSKYYTVDVNGVISNILFVGATRAIRMDNGRIISNRFENSSGTVIKILDGIVRGNIIHGGKYGIKVEKGIVQNNTIDNISHNSIHMSHSPISENSDILQPIIALNLIHNCGKNAIYITGDIYPIITQNALLDNNNGIFFDETSFYLGKTSKIYYNAFYNNDNNVYFNREDPRIEQKLQNNWWGTNDTKIIENKIYYESDDPRLTATLYMPLLEHAPLFLPRIPYEISLSNLNMQVDLEEKIILSGNISPPLRVFDLSIRYDGPDGRYYKKEVYTSTDGVFIDEFSPTVEGKWNITIDFIESESYLYKLTQEVLVNNTENGLQTIQNIPTDVIVIEEIDYTDSNDESEPIENDLENQSNVENPDTAEETSTDENDSNVELDASYETEDSEIQLVSHTEEENKESPPLTFGFIPSILTIIIMIAVYLGTQRLR